MRNRRATGQAPGPDSPFSAGCPVMGSDDGGIDHLQGLGCWIFLRQGIQQELPDAALGPALELLVDRIPFAVALGHVAPLRPGPRDPQDPVQRAPMVQCRAPTTTFPSNKRLEYCPFFIRQIAPTQGCLLRRSSLESRSDSADNHFVNRP
jgi:hypothetical protein